MHQTNILIVGGPGFFAGLADAVRTASGLRVTGVDSAAEARALIAAGSVDTVLAIVDIFLPDGQAFALCADLAQGGKGVPVMTVGDADEAGALRALEAGAIDHFARPGNRAELVARLRAHLRSIATSLDVEITVGPFIFRPGQRALVERRTHARIWLTAKETRLLRRLHLANGQPVPSEALIAAAWSSPSTSVHTLHTHVYRLRSKLGVADSPTPMLHTTREGYALVAP